MTTSLDHGCSIDTSQVGAGSAVEVAGTLTWHSAPDLHAALSSLPGSGRVLIDVTEVDAMDSYGTGELIAAAVRARQQDTELALVTGSSIADILESVGIGDSVLVFLDRASAYAWVGGERAGYPLGR